MHYSCVCVCVLLGLVDFKVSEGLLNGRRYIHMCVYPTPYHVLYKSYHITGFTERVLLSHDTGFALYTYI